MTSCRSTEVSTSRRSMRGFLAYLLILSGFVIIANRQFVTPTAEEYIRLAGAISLLGFLAGYKPSLFQFIERQVSTTLKIPPTETTTTQTSLTQTVSEVTDKQVLLNRESVSSPPEVTKKGRSASSDCRGDTVLQIDNARVCSSLVVIIRSRLIICFAT